MVHGRGKYRDGLVVMVMDFFVTIGGESGMFPSAPPHRDMCECGKGHIDCSRR